MIGFDYRLWRGHLGARACLRWPHGVIIDAYIPSLGLA